MLCNQDVLCTQRVCLLHVLCKLTRCFEDEKERNNSNEKQELHDLGALSLREKKSANITTRNQNDIRKN